MRRLFAALAALTFAAGTAAAAPQCSNPADQATYEVLALRQMMTVLATKNCGRENDYNNIFIKRFQPALQANYRGVQTYFRKIYGGAGQGKMDLFTTELVNIMSQEASRLGVEFCGRAGLMINEIAALRTGEELTAYAGVKNLPPQNVSMCPPAPAARRR